MVGVKHVGDEDEGGSGQEQDGKRGLDGKFVEELDVFAVGLGVESVAAR